MNARLFHFRIERKPMKGTRETQAALVKWGLGSTSFASPITIDACDGQGFATTFCQVGLHSVVSNIVDLECYVPSLT